MLLKICGITRLEDAEHAVRQGATAIGLVFWAGSPRAVSVARAAAIAAALPPDVMRVGVFVDESLDGIRRIVADVCLTTVQLHGSEPPEYGERLEVPVLRSVTIDEVDAACAGWPPETTLLLDAADPVRRGGTGVRVDWTRAAVAARRRRLVLAGGLAADNVAEAIEAVRPFGVDVSSGVEAAPGVKDPDKVTRFLSEARSAFAGGARSGANR